VLSSTLTASFSYHTAERETGVLPSAALLRIAITVDFLGLFFFAFFWDLDFLPLLRREYLEICNRLRCRSCRSRRCCHRYVAESWRNILPYPSVLATLFPTIERKQPLFTHHAIFLPVLPSSTLVTRHILRLPTNENWQAGDLSFTYNPRKSTVMTKWT
jgi:hypothetical protein